MIKLEVVEMRKENNNLVFEGQNEIVKLLKKA